MPDRPKITTNLTIRRWAYKTGLRLMRIDFIRRAVEDRADLSVFNNHLPKRLILGLLLIAGSNVVCWPSISFLAAYALRTKQPMLAAVGAPIIYSITFLCSLLGMICCSGKDARTFLRWRARRWTEWLLSHGEEKLAADNADARK